MLDGTGNTNAIGIGLTSNDVCLPHIEQTSYNVGQQHEEQRHEGRHTEGSFSKTRLNKDKVMGDIEEVFMHESDQDTDNPKPDMQPEPILHFAWQAPYKAPAQSIRGDQEHQRKGNNANLT